MPQESSSDSGEFIFDFPNENNNNNMQDYNEVYYPNCLVGPLATPLTNITTLTSWLLTSNLFTSWTPLHHVYFQLGHFLLLIYFVLNCSKSLLLSFVAIIYSVFMLLWGVLVIQAGDLVFWNLCFLSVNGGVLVFRGAKFLCCCCKRGFGSKEIEQVFRKLFEPLHVNRGQFSRILSCKRNTRSLHPGEHYAVEKSTRVDSLALLLSGRLLVSQQGRPLHIILPHQFVDSPEYFGVSTDELFQVTITAVEESKLLVWHRDKLRLTILSDNFLREMFDHIIGRDVVRKLIQVSDSVSIASNGYNYMATQKNNEIYTTITPSANENEPMLDANNDIINNHPDFESGNLKSFITFFK